MSFAICSEYQKHVTLNGWREWLSYIHRMDTFWQPISIAITTWPSNHFTYTLWDHNLNLINFSVVLDLNILIWSACNFPYVMPFYLIGSCIKQWEHLQYFDYEHISRCGMRLESFRFVSNDGYSIIGHYNMFLVVGVGGRGDNSGCINSWIWIHETFLIIKFILQSTH